jgi:ABC-type transport system substrate-binding protein
MKPTPVKLTRFLPVFLGLTLLAATDFAADTASRQGGTLHLARPNDPQTLDPVLYQLADDFLLFSLLYLPLLDNTNGVELVSCAARDWNVSSDARTFTFHLRPGIKFSNGRTVVVADYAYYLERMSDPRTASPFFAYLGAFHIRGAADFAAHRTNHLAGVRTEGTQTLVVELDQPDPTFPYVYICALPREEAERMGAAFGVHPIGDGPYMVEEWIRGVRLVFKHNPFYSGPEPRHFDRIEIMIGGDEATHQMMFERGELDIASIASPFSVPEADQARIMRDPRWEHCVERIPLFASGFVNLNTEMPPLDDRRVRQAINYAVDKTRRVASGRFTPAKGLIPPVMPAYNMNLAGYPFDPPKARRLLAESGIPLPIHLTLWYETDQDSIMSAQEIQADLREVGIELELKQATVGELYNAAAIRGNVQMCLGGWFTGMPDPKDMLGTQFDGRALTNAPTFNVSFYNNPEVNRLLDEASRTVEPAHRIALYREIEEIIVGDAACLFLKHPNVCALRQPWLKGPLLEPLWPIRLDRVWIER